MLLRVLPGQRDAALLWSDHFASTLQEQDFSRSVACPTLFRDTRSSTGVDQERSEELAYRGVLPLALGRCLCGSGVAAGADDVEEEHAVLRRMEAVMAEAEARSSRIKRHMPVVRFTSLLLLGLRCIRAQYQQRTKAYMDLAIRRLPAPEAPPGPEVPPAAEEGRNSLQLWLDGPGAQLVSQISLAAAQRGCRCSSGETRGPAWCPD